MSNWKSILGQTAPLLGSLLGGSLGVSIAQLLGKVLLGNEKASQPDIEKALLNPTPAQLVALRQMESDLQTKLAEFTLDEKKLVIRDRANAREREVQTRDNVPALLATLLTLGFFGILSAMMFFPIEKEAGQVVDVMLGALGTAWISCITYYFGSSHGSQAKNQLLINR